MNLHEEIRAAIGTHGMWKTHFYSAIERGVSEFSAATVQQDNQCAFGKWLHSLTIPAGIKSSLHYRKCRELHSKFHAAAAGVLLLALAGRKTEATLAMSIGSEFTLRSASLTTAMMEWYKAVTHQTASLSSGSGTRS